MTEGQGAELEYVYTYEETSLKRQGVHYFHARLYVVYLKIVTASRTTSTTKVVDELAKGL
jgi:hypothetical protein